MVFIPLPDLNHEFESDIKDAGCIFTVANSLILTSCFHLWIPENFGM